MREKIKNSNAFKKVRSKFVRTSQKAALVSFLIFVFFLISTADYGAEKRDSHFNS